MPTTTEPSPLTPLASLTKSPPGRSPRGVRLAAAKTVETAPPNSIAATILAVQTNGRIERGDLVIVSAAVANGRMNRTRARRFINGSSQVERFDRFQLTLELPRIGFV